MKHTMTQLEGKINPMGFAYIIFGNCFMEVDQMLSSTTITCPTRYTVATPSLKSNWYK